MLDSDNLTLAIVVLCLIALPIGAYFAVKEQKQWEQFKLEHKCTITSVISATSGIGTGVTSNGSVGTVIITNPAKTGWTCDDGVIYYR